MNEQNERFLRIFPAWIRTLGSDALELAVVLDDATAPQPVRLRAAGALNYLFKSLDLIPDGIEDLGFIDDAFVLRVTAALAGTESGDYTGVSPRLSEEAALVRDFLGPDYARLEGFVSGLTSIEARGRAAEAIVDDPEVRGQLMAELNAWAGEFDPPALSRDSRILVKLRAFLASKLPAPQ